MKMKLLTTSTNATENLIKNWKETTEIMHRAQRPPYSTIVLKNDLDLDDALIFAI
jgi:hypothetical protein